MEAFVTLVMCLLIAKADSACIHSFHMEQNMETSLTVKMGCEVRVDFAPGLISQVTCNPVAADLSLDMCTDKALTIISGDNGEEDTFCIITDDVKNAGRRLQSSITRQYKNQRSLTFKVDFMKRMMDAAMTACSISTKENDIAQIRGFSSLKEGMLGLPVGFDFLNEALDCGKVKVIPEESRIFGGQEAIEHNYNFMVVLIKEDRNGNRALCGGIILSDTKVVTAAHCTYGAARIWVFYGVHKLSEARSRRNMKSYIIHEDYKFPNHDISIITVDEPFPFSANVGKSCLPNIMSQGLKSSGDKLLAVGWGRTETERISNVLKESFFSTIDAGSCRKVFGNFLDSSVICTQDVEGESVCQGDSGSALGRVENGRFVLYGVISFTASSCSQGFPAGYTGIQSHMDWIMKHT